MRKIFIVCFVLFYCKNISSSGASAKIVECISSETTKNTLCCLSALGLSWYIGMHPELTPWALSTQQPADPLCLGCATCTAPCIAGLQESFNEKIPRKINNITTTACCLAGCTIGGCCGHAIITGTALEFFTRKHLRVQKMN